MDFRKIILAGSEEHCDDKTGSKTDRTTKRFRPTIYKLLIAVKPLCLPHRNFVKEGSRYAVIMVSSLLLLNSMLSLQGKGDSSVELPASVRGFFDLNCYECHNEVDKKGELDLEALSFDPSNHSILDLWAFVHDRVRDGEMPPPEDSLVEPEERSSFLKDFEKVLHDVSREELVAKGRVKSRRLNRIEYENTIQDLLGVKIPILELLPEDVTTDGFSNIAEAQQVSYHLLQKYLEVVDLMLDESFQRAIYPPMPASIPLSKDLRLTEIDPFATSKLPTIFFYEGYKTFLTSENKTYRYENGQFVDIRSSLDLSGTLARNAEIAELLASSLYKRIYLPNELGVGSERTLNERQGIYYNDQILSFPTKGANSGFHGRMAGTEVPETDWYRISVKAKAHSPPEGRNVWGRIHTGILRAKAPAVYWVGKFEATRELQEFVFDAWIRKGHIIGIQPTDKTLDWNSSNKVIQDLSVVSDGTAGIAVESLEIERIYPGLETPELRQRLFGKLKVRDGELVSRRPEYDLKKLMGQFAERTYRRPVSTSELEPYYVFAKEALDSSGSLLKAVKAGYRAILSSHRFVYFAEDPGKLDDYSIATRLSYFLWSSPPDEELLTEARKKRLSRPRYLKAQVDRMLNDPRAEAFVRNFADSWLELRDISFTTPDAKLYPEFDNILLDSMLDETRMFLQHMIEENLSVTNVIDSDFAMLNERLAKHYGMEFGTETGLQKVPLSKDQHRGGIITQASVLKVTANGTTTSPIMRGVWLMERILGKHIPPPPDQVPAIEPDIRGAISIRDQLDKHRSIESCMICHRKIDPPGFALENYDVIGGWRENYRAIDGEAKKWTDGPHVDASYQLPDGNSFQNITGFKKLALSDPKQITHNLVNQVTTYATGAEIEFADRREIDQIVEVLAEDGYGFRSLIHAVTQSDIFLSK